MSRPLDHLLSALEQLSAQALAVAATGDLVGAEDLIRRRGEAVEQLPAALAAAGEVSYQDWNRLVVIHHQGNRLGETLRSARFELAAQVIASAREQALLHCVAGIAAQRIHPTVNEMA